MNQIGTRTATMVSIVSVLLFIPAVTNATEKWILHGTKQGVTVYTNQLSGSQIPIVKAITILDVPTDVLWAYVTGPETDAKGLKQREKLGSCGSTCEYIYMRIGHVLIQDRHYVIKVETLVESDRGKNKYRRTWRRTEERKTIGEGAIEVEKISGSWELEPVEDGTKTRLIYTNHMEMGGNVDGLFFRLGFINKAYSIVREFRKLT